MGRRKLSNEEVAQLGLGDSAQRRQLSSDEVAQLGLESELPGAGKTISPIETAGTEYADTLTGGFSDELGAGLQAAMQALPGGKRTDAEGREMSALDVYRAARGENRADAELGRKQNPTASKIGTGLGVGASLILPGVAAGKAARVGAGIGEIAKAGALTGLKQGAFWGGLAGAGNSEADLTRGEVGRLAFDTAAGGVGGAALGAGLGAGASAAGAKGSQVMKWLRDRTQRGISEAGAKLDDLAKVKVEKPINEAAGALGGESQKGYRTAKDLLDLQREGRLTPEGAAKLKELEDSGVVAELLADLEKGKLRDLPGQKRAMDARRADLEKLQAGKPEALKAAREDVGDPKAIWGPAWKRYGAPAVGGSIGAVIGNAVAPGLGGYVGMNLGQLAGGQVRPMQHAIMRRLTHPGTAEMVWKAIQKMTPAEGGLASRAGGVLSKAAKRGPHQLALVHQMLLKSEPEYARMVAGLFSDEPEGAGVAAR